MKRERYILGDSYIFAFVGDGVIKCFKTKYTATKGTLYGSFDCGVEVRLDSNLDTEYINYFNITDKRLNDYINSGLYIFSSKEKMDEILPKIIKANLDSMKERADLLMIEYMKLADDCTSIETAFTLIKKGKLKLTNPFEK